jgi:hypothetical protein
MCLTDDRDVAESYAKGNVLAEVSLDLGSLNVVRVDGYDRVSNRAPGDRASEIKAYALQGIDVILYSDEDESGRAHETWRLVSERAAQALVCLEIASLQEAA